MWGYSWLLGNEKNLWSALDRAGLWHGKPEGGQGTVPTSWRAHGGRGQIQNHFQPHEAEGNVCFGMYKEVRWTQFTATLAACPSILFTCACDIRGPRAIITVSDVMVLLAQEIFMDLIHTIYRHCVVSDTFRKTPHSKKRDSKSIAVFWATHQSNTLHWVSPLKVTERSGQGGLQAQGSDSYHRYYQRHTNEPGLSISAAYFPVKWLAASSHSPILNLGW